MKHIITSLITRLRAYQVYTITLLVVFILVSGIFVVRIGPMNRKSRSGRWTYVAQQTQQLATTDFLAFKT